MNIIPKKSEIRALTFQHNSELNLNFIAISVFYCYLSPNPFGHLRLSVDCYRRS